MSACINGRNAKTNLLIDSNELRFQKGDCISFQIDSVFIGVAIIVDYSEEEGGIWYGLCFTNYFDSLNPDLSIIRERKIFGRKIESTLNKDGYIIGLDTEFVNDSCFIMNKMKINIIGNFTLKSEKIILGSQGATSDYQEMISTFRYGLEKRLLPPDDYRDHIKKHDKFKPDEYFLLKDYIIE